MTLFQSLVEWQAEKDKEDGYYVDGITMDKMLNWDLYFGKALIVTRVEKWIGQDSKAKIRVDFSSVVK